MCSRESRRQLAENGALEASAVVIDYEVPDLSGMKYSM
jgi:hypothetical protein